MRKQCCKCKAEGIGPKAIHFFSKKEWNRPSDGARLCSQHSLEQSRAWNKKKRIAYKPPGLRFGDFNLQGSIAKERKPKGE